jgi:hypothetical protein
LRRVPVPEKRGTIPKWHAASRPCRGLNGFHLPSAFAYLNACARSAPLANPLTRSGVSRTIIRPQTLVVVRPPFRYVRAFRLRVPGAALPGGRNVLRPSRHGSCRARNRSVKTGLRPRRPQTPGPAAPVPLRLHSRTLLHSGRPTASDCSFVRLLTPPARADSSGARRCRLSLHPLRGTRQPTPTRPEKRLRPTARRLAAARLMRRGVSDARVATPLNEPTPPARSQAHSPPRWKARE